MAGINFVRTSSNTNTSEGNFLVDGTAGDIVTYAVSLASQPSSGNVVLNFTSSDTTEGTVTPSLTFTGANWNIPQILIIRGVDDMRGADVSEGTIGGNVAEGSVSYKITTVVNQSLTTATEYKGIVITDLSLQNNDDIEDVPINDYYGNNYGKDIFPGNVGIDDPTVSMVDYITGSNLDDRLYASRGMDEIKGGLGNDLLYGESGNDVLYGQEGNDILYGDYDNDTLNGDDDNDKLYGEQDNDILNGGNGNDILDGGLGADTMHGGVGNDIYIVGDLSDDIDDQGASTDIDIVFVNIPGTTPYTYTLPANIESSIVQNDLFGNAINNLIPFTPALNTTDDIMIGSNLNDQFHGGYGIDILSGGFGSDWLGGDAGSDTLSGNQGDDTLYGGYEYDTLNGGDGNDYLYGEQDDDVLNGDNGNDYLDGGFGIDTMSGSIGNDIYVVDDTKDAVNELGNSTDVDTVLVNIPSATSFTYVLPANIENGTLQGNGNITLNGNTLNNYLTGSGGNNVLNGSTGNDTLDGGWGNDTYIVDTANVIVIENSGEDSGIDIIKSSVSFILPANVENLSLTDTATNATGNTGNNTITGNSVANVIDGGKGNDVINGGDGNDVLTGGTGLDKFVLGQSGIDKITDFNSLDDTILLPTGLLIYSGIKTGVLAADYFTVNAVAKEINDYVIYNKETGQLFYDPDGSNSIGQIQIGLLGTNLSITNADFLVYQAEIVNKSPILSGTQAILNDGTENSVYSLKNSDLLQGFTDADNDILSIANLTATHGTLSNNGNGTWNFTPEANYSGAVDLTYTVTDGKGGNVLANQDLTLKHFVPAGVTFTHDSTTPLNTSEGNALGLLENRGAVGVVRYFVSLNSAPAYGATGYQVILDFASNDTSEATVTPSLTFTSSNWNVPQTLTITGVDDYLNDGNIAYVITAQVDQKTTALEYKTLMLDNFNLTNEDDVFDKPLKLYGLDDPLKERVDYLKGNNGNDALYGGNGFDELKGNLGNDTLYGENGEDNLYGGDNNDALYGGNDNDVLYGEMGNDLLNGEFGADTMIGGAGNDVYYVDNSGDKIDDQGLKADIDKVIITQTIRYTLGASVENGSLDNTAGNSELIGNSLNNTLVGNIGDNLLNGGKGNDILTGGLGKDTFVFNTALAANKDKISDFNVADDTLALENALFTKLTATGVLNPAYFRMGTVALDNNDYLFYNKTTGGLFYDADGSGAIQAIQIATLGINLNLTNSDFVII